MFLTKWTSSIFKKGSEIIQSAADAVTQIGKDVASAVDESVAAVKEGMDALREQGEAYREEVKNAFSGEGNLQERLEDAAKAGEKAFTGMGDALEETGQSLKQSFDDLLAGGLETVRQGAEDIRNAGRELVEDTRDMVTDEIAKIKEGAERIEEAANSWIEGVKAAVEQGAADYEDNAMLPSAHIAYVNETDMEKGEANMISLDHLDGKNLNDMTWNAALTQFGLDKLGLTAAGKAGGLVCKVDESGKILEIQDEEGGLVLTLTLLAPGEAENGEGGAWSVRYEQNHGLAHPLGTLAHNDMLLLPLFADSISEAGWRAPNAIGIALTDDGPKPQFSSNFLILDALGNELLDGINGVSGGSLGDFVRNAVFDSDGKVDVSLDEMLADMQAAGSNALSGVLSLDNQDAIKDLVSVLIDQDLGQGIKDFIQNNILMILVPQATKDSLIATVDDWLNYNDTRRPVEGAADAKGMLSADFGLDGPATEHTRPAGWTLLHGDAEPAPVGWSVSGVQAMFDLMQIRASLYQDTRLVVSAAPGDNFYPPQKLVAMAGDVEVMTIEVDASSSGQYGYVIHQNTGLSHDQNSLLNTLLGLVENSSDYDAQLASLVDMIMEGLESALGSFSGLVLGALDADLKTLLQETLTVEHIVNTFSTDNLLYLPLPYITMDGDGDVTANLAFHAIKDSVPMIEGEPAVLVVAETDLDHAAYIGSDSEHLNDDAGRPGSDESRAEGSLVVTSFDGIGSISIGETLVWDGKSSPGPVEGRYGVFEITEVSEFGGGRYQVHYSYKLERSADHEAPALGADYNRQLAGEDAEESFMLTIKDGDGDFVNATVGVGIVDDIPFPLNIVDADPLARVNFEGQGLSGIGAEGDIALNYGADGPAEGLRGTAFQVGFRPEGNGEIEYRSEAEDGFIKVGGKYGDLFVDAESGKYHYILDQEKVESAEPGGRYESQLVPKEYNLADPAATPQNMTGVLYQSIEAFKGKSYSDSMVQDGLNSSKFASWRNSSKATVSKTNEGFGVAGRSGGILTSDGDKIGFGLSGLTLVHEAVLIHLTAATSSLGISFGDVGNTDVGKVFLYDADGGYLGMRYFGNGHDSLSSISVQEGDFAVPVKSFLVVPQTGNFTIESVTVPEAQEVWVPNSGDDLRISEDFSYVLTDADGDSVAGNLKLDLGKPDDMDFNMGDKIYGDDSDAVLNGSDYNDMIFGGSGNELILAGEGNNEIWGGDGADTFAWDLSSLAAGRDNIMDFSSAEGDRLSFGDFLEDGNSLDAFLQSHVSSVDLNADTGHLSFMLEMGETAREVSIRFTEYQTQDFNDFAARYSEVGVEEQTQLAMELIKSLCV